MTSALDFFLEGLPDGLGEFGALLLDDGRSEESAVARAVGQGTLARPTVEEAGSPEIARTGGVDDRCGGDGCSVKELISGGDPGAFCADLYRGDGAEFGECACHGGVVVTQSGEGGGFFFVGKDDIDRIAEDFPEGIARGLDDFERGEIQADGATGFFGEARTARRRASLKRR